MKKIFSNIALYVLPAMVILVPLAIAFHEVYDVILAIGSGSLVVGILITPFVIIGVVNVVRGFRAVLEIDEAKYGHKLKNSWKFGVYLVLHIGGYLALFYAIIRCL
jgi:hypothetical protein